jgi:hypothetical protein
MAATYSWIKSKSGRAGRRLLALSPLRASSPLADQGEGTYGVDYDEDDPFAVAATDTLPAQGGGGGRGRGVWDGGWSSSKASPTISSGRGGHQKHRSHANLDYDYNDKADTVIRKVLYHDRDHVSVLFQMHGSVWPQVLPFCIFNIAFTFLVYYLKVWGYDITSSTIGHKFMSTMVRTSILFIYLHSLPCKNAQYLQCIL